MIGTGHPCCNCTPCRCLQGSVTFSEVSILLSAVVIPPHATGVTATRYRIQYNNGLFQVLYDSQDADFYYYITQHDEHIGPIAPDLCAVGVRLSKDGSVPPRVVFVGGWLGMEALGGPEIPTLTTGHFESLGGSYGGIWECSGGAYTLIENNNWEGNSAYLWKYDEMLISGLDRLFGTTPALFFDKDITCCSDDDSFPFYANAIDVPLVATVGLGPFEGYGEDCKNCAFNNLAGEYEVTAEFSDIIDMTTHWLVTYGTTVNNDPIAGTTKVVSLTAYHPKTADQTAHYFYQIEYGGGDTSPLCDALDGFAKWAAWFFHDTCHFGGTVLGYTDGIQMMLDSGSEVDRSLCPPPTVNNIYGVIDFA